MKANSALRLLTVIGALALLGSCTAPPPPAPPPPAPKPAPPPPPPPPAPVPPANWRDIALAPGDWRWAIVNGRSTASFGVPGSAPLFTLACDKPIATVLLARSGPGGTQHMPMAVTTSTGTRPLLSEPLLSPPGWLVAELKASDPVLDAMAFSRGRFALDAAGTQTLALPSWPEVSRVIEDCR